MRQTGMARTGGSIRKQRPAAVKNRRFRSSRKAAHHDAGAARATTTLPRWPVAAAWRIEWRRAGPPESQGQAPPPPSG